MLQSLEYFLGDTAFAGNFRLTQPAPISIEIEFFLHVLSTGATSMVPANFLVMPVLNHGVYGASLVTAPAGSIKKVETISPVIVVWTRCRLQLEPGDN